VADVAVVVPLFVEAKKIDINTASVAELIELPGIGPALAARIVAYRTEHGLFRTVDDLTAVKGIGPATIEGLRESAVAGG
jgi:competence protein ComEA